MYEVEDIKEIFKFRKELGSGSFGTVHKGLYIKTKTPVAIKIINKKKLDEKNSKILQKLLAEELKLLTILEHPHIVRTISTCEDDLNFYVAFELMSKGNLAEVLRAIKEK